MTASLSNHVERWLHALLARAVAVAGTVHRRDGDGLRLVAAVNIPPPVRAVVEYVPSGKGMAGIALASGQQELVCKRLEIVEKQETPGPGGPAQALAGELPVAVGEADGLARRRCGDRDRRRREAIAAMAGDVMGNGVLETGEPVVPQAGDGVDPGLAQGRDAEPRIGAADVADQDSLAHHIPQLPPAWINLTLDGIVKSRKS